MNASEIIDGRYRLERLLGTGGMAEVWLAEDQRLRRWVAVKILRESFSAEADAATIAAFEREATVIAKLQHQNIVGVYDAGAHEGRRYIVMEYVHGYSLRQLLETQGRLTEAEAIRYGVQIAGALQHAHGHGVVHCDIKPENVLISEAGVAKVADFGVAETITRTMAPGQAQDLLGTIAYLAPEIIEGSAPSPASDTYSLGLTLFELVAARPPFGGTTAGASLGQRLATPAPALRTFARGASAEFEAVLSRALALSPLDRYPNAGAFAAALQRIPITSTTTAAPIAAPPGRPPQLQRRHNTAKVLRSVPPAGGAAIGASTILLAVGVVLAALGVGIAAALLITQLDDESGGSANETPTAAPTAAPTTATAPASRTAPPNATQTPTREPTAEPSPNATPTRTPTPAATPTRTPTGAPTTAATATRTPTPPASPAATATP